MRAEMEPCQVVNYRKILSEGQDAKAFWRALYSLTDEELAERALDALIDGDESAFSPQFRSVSRLRHIAKRRKLTKDERRTLVRAFSKGLRRAGTGSPWVHVSRRN